MFGDARDGIVALRNDAEDASAAGFDFLQIGECFFVGGVLRSDDDNGEAVVDEGDGTVFHFSGWVGFGMDVGEFFEFESALAGNGIERVASEVEERVSA